MTMPVAEILRVVANSYGVATADLKRAGRSTKAVSEAKKRAIGMMREKGFSLPMIGRLMGGMHHTTVLYHLRREARDSRQLSPSNAQRLGQLEAEVLELRAAIQDLAQNPASRPGLPPAGAMNAEGLTQDAD